MFSVCANNHHGVTTFEAKGMVKNTKIEYHKTRNEFSIKLNSASKTALEVIILAEVSFR